MAIKDWPESERPRERLLAQGAPALSDAELLAIFLRVGVAGRSAIDLAGDLIARFQSINALFTAPREEFVRIKGLGEAKYVQLMAVHELAKRALTEEIRRDTVFNAPGKVRDYLKLRLGALPHEVFMALFLDAQNRLLAPEELFRGTLTQTSVYPREVVKRALSHNAAAVIFAHNHPSGVAEPSRADELLTRALKDALQLIDVRVLDHLIVGHGDVTSFAERGLL
ncbi:MAG: DNA repair protein RadC [Burkholderiaceae bacterium]|jgi:DNA repair protein RadC|nr:DNA repair protein RadC [Burkholderiaceae bacterium]